MYRRKKFNFLPLFFFIGFSFFCFLCFLPYLVCLSSSCCLDTQVVCVLACVVTPLLVRLTRWQTLHVHFLAGSWTAHMRVQNYLIVFRSPTPFLTCRSLRQFWLYVSDKTSLLTGEMGYPLCIVWWIRDRELWVSCSFLCLWLHSYFVSYDGTAHRSKNERNRVTEAQGNLVRIWSVSELSSSSRLGIRAECEVIEEAWRCQNGSVIVVSTHWLVTVGKCRRYHWGWERTEWINSTCLLFPRVLSNKIFRGWCGELPTNIQNPCQGHYVRVAERAHRRR